MALTAAHEAFFARMDPAVRIARAKGAILNAVATVAQAAHESGWGTSLLAREASNLFGIKASRQQIAAGEALPMPTREWTDAGWVRETAYWVRYPSWNECLVAYSLLVMSLPWFTAARAHADPPHGDGDALGWLRGLEEPGRPEWATDPEYVARVSALFDEVRAYLGTEGGTA
jgi:flagellum-specific peptidoglycan hydrolase FlgJ